MYDYSQEKPKLFTEEGVQMLMNIRDKVTRLIKAAGAVRMQEATTGVGGDTWVMFAALDYLVEQEYLKEVTDATSWGQNRIYVAGRKF